jgi:hypothetical protein
MAVGTTLPRAASNEKCAGANLGTVMIAVLTPAVAAEAAVDVRVTVVGAEVAAIGRAAKVGARVVTTGAEMAVVNRALPVTTSIPKQT